MARCSGRWWRVDPELSTRPCSDPDFIADSTRNLANIFVRRILSSTTFLIIILSTFFTFLCSICGCFLVIYITVHDIEHYFTDYLIMKCLFCSRKQNLSGWIVRISTFDGSYPEKLLRKNFYFF